MLKEYLKTGLLTIHGTLPEAPQHDSPNIPAAGQRGCGDLRLRHLSQSVDLRARERARVLAVCEMEVVAFDSGPSEIALDAWRRYGKGRHPAGLNLGDYASYALADE